MPVAAARPCGGRARWRRSSAWRSSRPRHETAAVAASPLLPRFCGTLPAADLLQRGEHLLLQPGEFCIAAARQGADDNSVSGLQLRQDGARSVPEPAGDAVPLDCIPHRLAHDESDSGTARFGRNGAGMDHQGALRHSATRLDRGDKIRRPCHPVPRREHVDGPESGSQRAAALAAAAGHDRTTGPGPHPQAETMDLRPPPIVGLVGPLALGHGSRLPVTSGSRNPAMPGDIGAIRPPSVEFPLVTSAPPDESLPVAAGSPTFGRRFEGTDATCTGQTAQLCPEAPRLWMDLRNRLAHLPKPVSFWLNTNEYMPTYCVHRPQKN